MIKLQDNEVYNYLMLLSSVSKLGKIKVNSKLLKQDVYVYYDNNIKNVSLALLNDVNNFGIDLLNDNDDITAYYIKDLKDNLLLDNTTLTASVFNFLGIDCKITKVTE